MASYEDLLKEIFGDDAAKLQRVQGIKAIDVLKNEELRKLFRDRLKKRFAGSNIEPQALLFTTYFETLMGIKHMEDFRQQKNKLIEASSFDLAKVEEQTSLDKFLDGEKIRISQKLDDLNEFRNFVKSFKTFKETKQK